ncbi:MAG: type II/IV secretion system protein, partial [Gammaproteobacteria bacterium]|nr:type II/IV secretion system protein [Gammaproteobacteria bacterium]
IEEEQWKQLVKPWKPARPKKIYKAVGCLECRNTGFLGRMGLYEMFTYSPALKKMMFDGASVDDIRQQAIKENMRVLRLSGAQKVGQGLTTVEEVMRVAPPPIGLD